MAFGNSSSFSFSSIVTATAATVLLPQLSLYTKSPDDGDILPPQDCSHPLVVAF
jgi:hypothetical protein